MFQASVTSTSSLLETDGASSDVLTRIKWLAVYTRSRHEKLLRDELLKKGVETFLPVRKVERHWSDRKKIIEEPLFSSYLFVKIPWTERFQVLNTVGAVRFIGVRQGNPVEVPEKEIETIRQFVSQEIKMDPFPYLKAGARVYIRSGPMKGAEGFVVYKNQRCRLVISLDLLMQSISVEIDQSLVEAI